MLVFESISQASTVTARQLRTARSEIGWMDLKYERILIVDDRAEA